MRTKKLHGGKLCPLFACLAGWVMLCWLEQTSLQLKGIGLHHRQCITPALNQTPMESPSCAGSGHTMGPSRRWTSRKDYLDLRVGVLKGLFGSYVPSPCFQSSCSYDEFPKD